ncbi:DUF7079 family protein [Pontibacter qinzhouensis]|uniref:DUF7079 family protein n=1 Tax=Pontibacter qinzhouensis TaxID=2603253 RepID=UPI0016500A27|nr:hypothetical protein [Pontibacter qinzhouensis]
MKDIDKRAEIWKVLSEFYLDTELQEADYLWIAKILKQSNLAITELKEIDLYEVFPSLQSNLCSVAGVWAGFDEEWLVGECIKNFAKREDNRFRFVAKLKNKISYCMRKHHWAKVQELMESMETSDDLEVGKFIILDTFNISERGIVLAGEIVKGNVSVNDWIIFEFNKEIRTRKIIGINDNRHNQEKPPRIGLLIQCKDSNEIAELRNWNLQEIEARLIKKNVL